ncbi:MAG: sulfurtransferase [Rhodospirillaceae bacterium]|nr:sulfurtransferase [Rhodospirillaceae bacterium]
MNNANPDSLVSTSWLADHVAAPDIRIVDGTFYLPTEGKSARAEYQKQHILGAVFFDIDEIADSDTDLPHMLPSPEKFSSRVRRLGLGDGNRIVVYDANGMGAARVWWTFRVFGHRDVAVLDGGMRKWLAEGRPIEDLPPMPRERHFTAQFNNLLVRNKGQVRANLGTSREQVLDARSRGRFAGTEPEPRAGLRSGHIPGSCNLPAGMVMDPADGTFLPPDILKKRFEEAGIDLDRPVITSCGSGVTAATLAFALHLIGHDDVAVYDGSWSEWGRAGDTPVETT